MIKKFDWLRGVHITLFGPIRQEAVLTGNLGKEASWLFMGVSQRAHSPSGCRGEDWGPGVAEAITATAGRRQDDDKGGTQSRGEAKGAQ